MKISCQSCQAKYTIADEKVLGKIVKIRCKKCGATIVINGNEAQQAHPAEDAVDTRVYDYTQQQSGDQWTVNVADGDQRTMGLPEVVSAFRAGTINEETYIWRDGMADWLPVREVPEVFSQCQMGPRPSLHNEQSVPPPAAAAPMGALFGPSTQDAPTEEVPAAANGTGALFGDAQPAPAAARRVGGRAGGADLFGGAATAGGEEDAVATSASAAGADKMTGARNENSVLFSLSALTSNAASGGATENKTTATGDGSGLIDIRALSASMGVDSGKPKQAHVDDIMNLGGGGAFGAALAAPVLAPPPPEAVDMGGGAQASKGKGLMFGLIGLGAFLFAGIIIAVLLLRSGGSSDNTSAGGGATATTPTATPTAATSVAAADTSTAPANTGGSAGGADTTAGGGAKPVTTGAAAKPAATGGAKPKDNTSTMGGAGTTKPETTAAAIPTTPPAGDKPKSLAEAMAQSAGGGTAAANTGGATPAAGPFDRGAAAAALGGVNVASCKKPDGPTGTGHVTVTFAPGGNVTSAVVDSAPFAGTPVGGCVAGKFRSARVPAFSGGNVTVGKSFSLN
jgi:predicted Zn finger-like uncharacterized protein